MGRIAGSSGPKTLAAIRRTGLRLIYQHGYEAMSLRQLATAVGIQQGSLYNHIRSKQDLLTNLVRGHMTHLLAALDRALDGIAGPLARLEAFAAFHVHYHMTRKQEVSVVNFELRSLEPANRAAIVKLRRCYEQRLQGIIADGIEAGVVAPTDVRVASYATLALLTGVCTWYRPRGRLSEAEIVAVHVRLALDGLRRRDGAVCAAAQQSGAKRRRAPDNSRDRRA